MSGRAMLASHPDYESIRDLTALLGMATNPHLCAGVENDMAEPERLALIQTLRDALAELLQCGPFADWLNGKDG